MRKIFAFIIPILLAISLGIYFFGVSGEYDFFTQLDKASRIEFVNPITEFQNIFDKFNKIKLSFKTIVFEWNYVNVNNPIDFFNNVGIFFNGLGNGFRYIFDVIVNGFSALWEILILPLQILKDIIIDVWYGIHVILTIMGVM